LASAPEITWSGEAAVKVDQGSGDRPGGYSRADSDEAARV
jgi:hypothetical protein